MGPIERYRRWRRYRRTLRELGMYAGHELRELGISPADITRVAQDASR